MYDIYLDNNATTRLTSEVKAALLEALNVTVGNPSSAHSCGSRAREMLRQAREAVAALLGGEPDQVIFVSGATEANNTVLRSVVGRRASGARVITTQVEHSSILRTCDYLEAGGADIVRLPVDARGLADVSDLRSAINDRTALVSVQWVNNETGVIQPIEIITETCRQAGVPFHTDAAQAVGKLRMELGTLPISYVSVAAHKLHAPQGVGALWARDSSGIRQLLFGGDQEQGRRAGTENLLGVVGFGAAARTRTEKLAEVREYLRRLRDEFEASVLAEVPDTRINGSTADRVTNCSNILFSGVDGEALVARLDQENICCSQGSACTSSRPEPSYVLRAMGLSEEEAYSSVRFSFSELNAPTEIDIVVDALKRQCSCLRAFAARRGSHAV